MLAITTASQSEKNAQCRNGANGEAETSPECW
jgi:hypothetical protein